MTAQAPQPRFLCGLRGLEPKILPTFFPCPERSWRAYVNGVSTRKVDRLVQGLGIHMGVRAPEGR